MKLLMMLTAAAAILVGLLAHERAFVVVGAAIHLLTGIAALCLDYRDAKLLRSGTLQPEPEPRLSARATQWIEWAITFTGLVLVVVTKDSDADGYALGGWIIWGGAIVCYIASGIIGRDVGGIPRSMGHGGWAVRRDRKGNLRR